MQKLHYKRICYQKKNCRVIQDYQNPSKIRMQRKMETDWAQKIYKKPSQTTELPFYATILQNESNCKFNYTFKKT